MCWPMVCKGMAGGSLKMCGLRPSSSNNATKLENITSGMRVLSYLATMQHPRNSAVLYVEGDFLVAMTAE